MDETGEEPGERDTEMEDVKWFAFQEAADVAGFDSEKDMIRQAAGAFG